MSRRLGAHDLVDLVLDEASFKSWDTTPITPAEMSESYAAELAEARERSGVDESVLTGEGRISGRRVAVVVCEFRFLAGSIGTAAAERLVQAVERATEEGLPLLAAPVSGGTRMQEGTGAFVQMAKITAVIARHKEAGLPYLVYLRHPTTGGVFASWGSFGHLTVAEPGALVGFLGPRVYKALYERDFPEDVQVSENLFRRGLIDAVVAVEDIAEVLDRALRVLRFDRTGEEPLTIPPDTDNTYNVADGADIAELPVWDSIIRSRRPERPGVRRLLRYAATDVVPLNGAGEGDPGLLIALARFGGAPCVFLGQDRRGQTMDRPMGPGALREARRGMRLADELHLPLLTVNRHAWRRVVGRGRGGRTGWRDRPLPVRHCHAGRTDAQPAARAGHRRWRTRAAARGPRRRGSARVAVAAAPEGASAIVHRTTERAAELAENQGVRSLDLLRAGIVDRIVPERADAADEPKEFCRRVGEVLRQELAALLHQQSGERLEQRHLRYRNLGLADRPT